LEFDRESGQLIQFFDRRQELELLQAPAAIARIIDDPSDTWSHGVNQFNKIAGQFGAPEFRICEQGPLRCTLDLKLHFNHSTFEQRWTLYRDEPRIAVNLKIDWHEQQRMLKYCFPLALQNPMCVCDQPYGEIQRPPDGTEQPFQLWLSVNGEIVNNLHQPKPYGIAFLNDGLYAYSLDPTELRLTLCRSAIHAHHDPSVPRSDAIYEYTDQGLHEIKLLIIPFSGQRIPAELIRLAHELNAPPMVLVDYPHSGYLPKINAFLEITAPNVIVTVFKKATDTEEFILRCYEVAGLETTTQLNLPYWKLSGEFTLKPFELKTFRLKIKASRLDLWDSNALEE
jgi:alpha-mannosidase